MNELGTCDLCDKPAQWAIVVKGCSEHKIALKYAVDNASDNSEYIEVLQSTLNYYWSEDKLNKKFIAAIIEKFKHNLDALKTERN